MAKDKPLNQPFSKLAELALPPRPVAASDEPASSPTTTEPTAATVSIAGASFAEVATAAVGDASIEPLKPAAARISPQHARRARLPSEPAPASLTYEIAFAGKALRAHRLDVDPHVLDELRRCRPQARLDLHGHTLEEARRRCQRFVRARRRRGDACVLLIVGKGHHSEDGESVLRMAISDWLTEEGMAASVMAFVSARREHGGSGAVYVALADAARQLR